MELISWGEIPKMNPTVENGLGKTEMENVKTLNEKISELVSEDYRGGEHPKFDKFAGFLTKVSDNLGWRIKIEEPWFMDYFYNGSGKVIFQPNQEGKPIEILPTTEDWAKLPFEDFLRSNKNPYQIIK